VLGAIGFAVASALGGLANNGEVLFAARALQGAFGALLAPASLALLTVMFTEARDRAKAFGVYGAIAGGGAAIGLVLGGVLTEYASWRWCLLVNIPVALLAIVGATFLVPESRAHGDTSYDVPGAVLATLGLASLVYGFTEASKDGWSSATTIAFIAAGVVLLAIFVVVEMRTRNPLLPLRVVLDRNRGGAYLSSTLVGAGLLGAFLFITFYFQVVLQYTPLKAGLATLPVTAGVLVSAGLASQLLPRVGAKWPMAIGMLLGAAGMLWFTQLGVDTSYVTHVLPGELLLGAGLGLAFVPLGSVALIGVGGHDAGVASAVVNASQQVGGSLGIALLNTIYATAVASYLKSHPPSPVTQVEGLVHGYTTAFAWAAGLLLLGAIIVIVLLRVTKDDLATDPATVAVR
jgi:EmrB/QacA subfamily drug resistance transporter